MAEKKDLGSAKRFGARYGRTVKRRLAQVEREQKKRHKCPYCLKPAVKRVFTGVWYCKNCGVKFTSRAYTLSKKSLTIKKKQITEISETPNIKEAEGLEEVET